MQDLAASPHLFLPFEALYLRFWVGAVMEREAKAAAGVGAVMGGSAAVGAAAGANASMNVGAATSANAEGKRAAVSATGATAKRAAADARGGRRRSGAGAAEAHTPKRAETSGKLFTMMEVCREADMTYQTLKFYCNQGLVPNVKRDKNNRRVFDERDVEWVKSLVRLKKCGMSIDEMRAYLALCLEGEASIPERKVMLAKKRARLLEQIAELEASAEFIDWKQGFYDDVLSGRTKSFSNLLPKDE